MTVCTRRQHLLGGVASGNEERVGDKRPGKESDGECAIAGNGSECQSPDSSEGERHHPRPSPATAGTTTANRQAGEAAAGAVDEGKKGREEENE